MYYDFKIGSGVAGIQSIPVSSGGSGYTSATISIVGGGGYGATATAVISDGVISAIEITNKGFSYTSQPNITISGNGIGAKAGEAVISSVNGSSRLTIVKDITHNIRFRKEILENITLYDEYDIIDGETPEIIAEKIYGNSQYHWIIMLLNERYDYITDFPLTYPELVSHTEQRYGVGNVNGIHHYLDFNGNRVDSSISAVTMTDFGSGYDSEAEPPIVTIAAPTGANPIQAYGVAQLSGGGIQSIAVRNAGNGYTSTSLSGVTITGTAGQFSCNATTLASGQVVIISGTLGGTGTISGYVNPTAYRIGVTNGTTTFTLIDVTTGAAIVTTAGTPTGLTYTSSSTTITIVGGGGSGATGQVVVSGGAVTQIIITNAGSGYTSQPYITIFGDGSNALAGQALIYTSAVVGVTIAPSSILGIEVVNSGSGYITIPNITIAPPPSGTTATAQCSILAYTPVTNIQYEEEINESKRRIKLITPELLNTILTNYKDIL